MADIDARGQATFEIVSCEDGSLAVVVHIPESAPVTVTPFATQEAADTWISNYRRRVAEDHPRKYWRARQGESGNRR